MGFLLVWLTSHFVIMLIIAKLLNVHAAWVPIASMANVGGIATAPAVTAAYEKKWMPHAIILAETMLWHQQYLQDECVFELVGVSWSTSCGLRYCRPQHHMLT